MKKNLTKSTAILLSTLSFGVSADIQWNGFSSVVGGQTVSSNKTLHEYDDSFSFDKDSLFALQASNDLGNGLSVAAQIIAHGNNEWDPEFEWAYVGYEVNEQLKVLIGRQPVPFYMYSDHVNVSYSMPWITAPKGLYRGLLTNLDGITASYTANIGDFEVITQAVFGSGEEDVEVGEAIVEEGVGLSFTATRDWLTLRAGYFLANNFSIETNAITPLLDDWSKAGYEKIASNIETLDDESSFTEVGFKINYNSYLVIGEFTHFEIKDSFAADQDSFYIMFGKRFGNFLAHATYGSNDGSPTNITQNIPHGIDENIDRLKEKTDWLTEQQDTKYDYVTLGLRWDFHDSAALKLEFTDMDDDIINQKNTGLYKMALVTVF